MKTLLTTLVLALVIRVQAQGVYITGFYADTTQASKIDTAYVGQTIYVGAYDCCFNGGKNFIYGTEGVGKGVTWGLIQDGVVKTFNFTTATGAANTLEVYLFDIQAPLVPGTYTYLFAPGLDERKLVVINNPVNGINEIETTKIPVEIHYYTLTGNEVTSNASGLLIKKTLYNNGSVVTEKIFN